MIPLMPLDLRGMCAVVTGASAGIGLACAEELARRGVGVVLGARREDRLRTAVDAITARGGRAIAVVCDVTLESQMQALIDGALSEFGRLDIMICNAGIGFHGSVDETDVNVMRRLMDVNFMGTFLGARAALPIFRRQRGGHLIIISSIVGQRGVGYMSGYAATKAAQIGFAESLRAEFAGTGVQVTVVCPISTVTEFHDAMRRDFGHVGSALGPRQSADDVARAVVRSVERPAAEVYPHWKSRALVVLNALAPGITDRVVQKYSRKPA